MMTYKEWDATEYIRDLTERNRLAQQEECKFALVSGWEGLTEVIQNMRKHKAFVAIDETAESMTHKVGAGYFETKVHTVFLLMRYKALDEEDRLAKLRICREIMRQFQAKMIIDAEQLAAATIYLDSDFQAREIGRIILNGLTGLYFTFSFDRPQELVLKADDWDNPFVTYGSR